MSATHFKSYCQGGILLFSDAESGKINLSNCLGRDRVISEILNRCDMLSRRAGLDNKSLVLPPYPSQKDTIVRAAL